MNPESIARELEIINNRDMSELTANMFMIELNKQLGTYPQLKNNPLILRQIERFEYELSLMEIGWAQEQLATLQRFKSERGILAGEVDGNRATVETTEALDETSAPRAGSKSLETLVPIPDSFEVLELTKSTLKTEGYEYTTAGVKEYQDAHNIGIDGVIGKETYVEMKTGVVLTDLSKKLEKEEKIIPLDLQNEIKFVWKYGKKDSTNMSALFSQLQVYQSNESIYDKNKTFLDAILGEFKSYTQSEDGIVATNSAEIRLQTETQGNGKTAWENIKEGNIEELIKNPTLLMTAGLLFLFGVIGGNTAYTDSVFKRIGWIIGGLFMGPKLYHEIVGPAINDGKALLRSPEAETAVATATSDAENIFKSARDWGVNGWNSVSSEVMAFFGETFKSHESQNEKEKTTGVDGKPSEKYINTFSEKWSYIMADTKLLTDENNIDAILGLTDMSETGLASILEPSTFIQLKALGLTNKDAENLLLWHIIPEAQKAKASGENITKFGEIFTSAAGVLSSAVSAVTATGAEALGYGIVTTGVLNIQIQDRINTLLLDLNSTPDAIKAAQNLRTLLRQNPIVFDYTVYPGITEGEKTQIVGIIQLVTDIRLRESILTQYKTQIDALNIDVSAMNDIAQKQILLEQRWNKLQGIKADYTSTRPNIIDIGVTTENLDTAFAQREREILDIALQSGITTLAGISVTTAVEQASTNEAVANGVTIMQEYLSHLEALPTPTATPLELKAWYERNKTALDEAETVTVSVTLATGSNEALIAEAAGRILERKERFIEIYRVKRGEYAGNLLRISDAIGKIDLSETDGSNFEATQNRFETLSQEYNNLVGNAIDASYVSKAYGLYDWISGNAKYTITDTNNAFTYIEGPENLNMSDPIVFTPDFSSVQTDISKKAAEIEKKFEEIIKEKVSNMPLNQITQEQFGIILAPLNTKIELIESFTEVLQNRNTKTVKDFLDVYNASIEAMTRVGDEEAIKILQESKKLFLERVKGGFTQDTIDWIQNVYGDIDTYYQSLL